MNKLEAKLKALKRLRPQVLRFAIAMEKKLRENDHKGGWEDCENDYLFGRLKEETEELLEAVECSFDISSKEVLSEAADVANFALMIADNYRKNKALDDEVGRIAAARQQEAELDLPKHPPEAP
jgi:NTP pyrophosphatase (non-canonical NTP hydrolase)